LTGGKKETARGYKRPRLMEGATAMEINGVAHVMLTVGNYEACLPFYEKLLPFLGLTFVVRKTDSQFYCIGGRTGIGIHKAAENYRGVRFAQGRAGLHHVCLRVRERKDVDAVYQFLLGIGGTIIHPPDEGAWASGYYSVLFEDPDGIRLEVNHIPGKGLLAEPPR
jgi:catechol 2,3-dioxygenase-like lactoylglutathione lyase family enzyme